MNINLKTSASLAHNTSDAIGLTVLKKAINIEVQNAMALVNAIPQPPQQGTANLSPYLGQNINTIA
jgi:hypothetical protein